MAWILAWLILAFSVWLTAAILPGMKVSSAGGALLVAAILGLLNVLIGWFIFLVVGIATLGIGFLLAFLTRWVVNAILLKITDAFTSRLTIRGFGTTMIAALLISLFGTLGEWLLRQSGMFVY